MRDGDRKTLSSPAWQRHRAARTLAQHATDARDLTELLDMFGLTAAEGRVPPDRVPAPAPARHPVKLSEDSTGRLSHLLRAAFPEARHHPGEQVSNGHGGKDEGPERPGTKDSAVGTFASRSRGGGGRQFR